MNYALTALTWFLLMVVAVLVVDTFGLGLLNGYEVTILSMVALVVAAFVVLTQEIEDRRTSRRRWEERGRQMVIAETIKHHAALREAQQAALRG